MVYRQPMQSELPDAPAVNESTNELNERTQRTGTQFANLVNACPPNQTFVSSHCAPEEGGDYSMQRYKYTCRSLAAINEIMYGMRPVYHIRTGHCQDDEICVTGRAPRLMASCVKAWLFDDYHIDKDGKVQPMLNGEIFSLDKLTIYAAVSEEDASTAVEVSSMNVNAWNRQERVDNGTVQAKKCRGCSELQTDVLEPKTDSLKVEATLMTAGAMAGIVWLSLMTG